MRSTFSIPERAVLPLAVFTFCLIWSSAFSVAKLALYDCPPLLLLTARFLLAGAITLGAAAFYADWRRLAGATWQRSQRLGFSTMRYSG